MVTPSSARRVSACCAPAYRALCAHPDAGVRAAAAGGLHDVALTQLSVTGTPATGETVHWLVEATLPVEQVGALVAHHSSASFLAFVEGGALALGGNHQNSLYQTSAAVDTSSAPFAGVAPSPPPSARRRLLLL